MKQAIKEAHDKLNLELWVCTHNYLPSFPPSTPVDGGVRHWCIAVVDICKKVNYLSNDKGILCFFWVCSITVGFKQTNFIILGEWVGSG